MFQHCCSENKHSCSSLEFLTYKQWLFKSCTSLVYIFSKQDLEIQNITNDMTTSYKLKENYTFEKLNHDYLRQKLKCHGWSLFEAKILRFRFRILHLDDLFGAIFHVLWKLRCCSQPVLRNCWKINDEIITSVKWLRSPIAVIVVLDVNQHHFSEEMTRIEVKPKRREKFLHEFNLRHTLAILRRILSRAPRSLKLENICALKKRNEEKENHLRC